MSEASKLLVSPFPVMTKNSSSAVSDPNDSAVLFLLNNSALPMSIDMAKFALGVEVYA